MHKQCSPTFPHAVLGFTLIELLFVILILGLLSTSSILFYQQRMQNQKIEKTVSQIQQWLQAGIAYRLQHERWPEKAQNLIDGKFIGTAQRSNPWCEDSCYEVAADPSAPNLFHVLVKFTAGGKMIRDAVAARLPYARQVGEMELLAVINVPLEGLSRSPHAILVDVRPFHIKPVFSGKELFKKETVASSHQSNHFAVSDDSDSRMLAGTLPSCGYYGDAYSLAMFPTIRGYATRYDTKDAARRTYFQQAIFSLLEVAAVESSGKVLLQIRARPQRTYYGSCFAKTDCLETTMVDELMKEVEIQGEVFFVCCKKGTQCEKPGLFNTNEHSQIVASPSTMSSSSSDFRF